MTMQSASSQKIDPLYYRLEPAVPLAEPEQTMVKALNRAVAEVAGVPVEQLAPKPLVSGIRHEWPFAYAMLPPHRPFRLASDDLRVVLNSLAQEMGVTAAFRRHQSLPEPGHA